MFYRDSRFPLRKTLRIIKIFCSLRLYNQSGTTFEQELIVSTLLVGALIGAFLGGFIADHFGRKKTLFFTLILFFIGTLLLSDGSSFDWLLIGRFISGLAIGIASVAVPLYIAEVSPAQSRGALVSLNQLLLTIGILIAYIVSYFYAEGGHWREMFAFGFIPIVLQFIGLFFIPESPAWLISRGRTAVAEKALHRLRIAHPNAHLANVEKQEDVPTRRNWREIFSPSVRKPFLVGIGIAVFQQVTGINTVIYYAPQIFQKAGFQAAETAILATVFVGVINVLLTIVALWLIDRVGRRPLLITGLIGMSAALAFLGFSFFEGQGNIGMTAIGAVLIYVAFFAMSLGVIAWLIISEVFPLGIRGRAMGIATFVSWVCNYLVSLTFLTLVETIGSASTFWLYAVICLAGLWFSWKMVPETKGKTFDEIQTFWKK